MRSPAVPWLATSFPILKYSGILYKKCLGLILYYSLIADDFFSCHETTSFLYPFSSKGNQKLGTEKSPAKSGT
jgi:hypothetical protein